ncbi:MAG: hypothetical protein ABW098_07590 [Candidatus Thiodiazotropha sp.]
MDSWYRLMRFARYSVVSSLLFLSILITTSSLQAETAIQDGAIPIEQLRAAQQKELDELRARYRTRANQPDTDQAKLLQQYKAEITRTQAQYNTLDSRNERVRQMLQQTGASQTGSDTKDVRADVDTAGNTDQIDEKMLQELKRRGHDIDTSDPSKVVDRTDDHVYWRKETAAGNKAKETDFDAYKTTGGREATGSPGEVRDARGEAIDLSSKYHHGRADGDLKTMGKAVSKIDKSSDRVKYDPETERFVKDQGEFRRSLAEHPDPGVRQLAEIDPKTGKTHADTLVDQAKAFQKYGDPVTAGIADLADSPEVQARKVKEWQKKANKFMKAAEQRAASRGDARDLVRENFDQSYRNAKTADPTESEWNRKAADDIDANRRRVRETNEVGDRFLGGEKRRKTSDDTYSGGWKDRGEEIKGAVPEEELKRRLGEADQPGKSNTKAALSEPDMATKPGTRTASPDLDVDLPRNKARPAWADTPTDVAVIGKGGKAKVTPIDGRTPARKPNIAGAVGTGLEAGVQMSEATAKKLGEVLDRDDQSVSAKDMADIVAEGSGIAPMRKAVKDTRLKNRMREIELEDRIRRLTEKSERLTAEEQKELKRLLNEAENADSYMTNAADLGQQMLIDPNKEIIQRRMEEMEAQAKEEGRRPEFLRDGIPAMAKIGAEAAGNSLGIGALANTAAEIDTYNERSDWSAQKKAMVQRLTDKARWATMRTQKAVAKLEGILYSDNPDSAANRQRIEQLLGEIAANQAEMRKLVFIANNNLNEVDPKKLATLHGLAQSHPDANSMRTYVKDILKNQWADAAKSEEKEDDEGWASGDDGYEAVSPAEQYIDAIVSANQACDYQHALQLANQARSADPEYAWLNQNFDTIQLLARREQAYQGAIQTAINALEQGKVSNSIDSLRTAMQNASTQCGQEQTVNSLLEDAKRIAEMERKDAIEEARREGARSAYERERQQARNQQREAERRRSARALQGALMGVLDSISRSRSSRNATAPAQPGYGEDIFEQRARENERKYGGLMEKYQRSQSTFTAPKPKRSQVSSSDSNDTAGWGSESTGTADSQGSMGLITRERGMLESKKCTEAEYEAMECFRDTRF